MTRHLEGRPTDEQKHRLMDFLDDLGMISRQHLIWMDTDTADVYLRDLNSRDSVVIGIGLTPHGRSRLDVHYDSTDSILDGVWPTDGPHGIQDQRDVQQVLPGPRDLGERNES